MCPTIRRTRILDETDRAIISLYYGLGGNQKYPFDQIGKMLGMTGEAVRQREANALKKLETKDRLKKTLKSFLPDTIEPETHEEDLGDPSTWLKNKREPQSRKEFLAFEDFRKEVLEAYSTYSGELSPGDWYKQEYKKHKGWPYGPVNQYEELESISRFLKDKSPYTKP
jgi:DNA-binding Lrp family transcriptional regulator